MMIAYRPSALALIVFSALSIGPALAQQAPQAPGQAQASPATAPPPAIEPKAVAILQAACDALANAKAMEFDALNTYERAARNGQPLFYSRLNHVTMQRPDKLRVIPPGDGVADEFYYDGKTIMAYIPSLDLVAVADAPPTVDQMIDAAWEKAAIYFPFSDVILSKPCAVFQENGMNSAFYIGQSKVIGGTTTDMVAVAGDDIQAELWIGAEDHLPRLVRVVYPHEPAHALYQTDYSNWHLTDSVDPGSFSSEKARHGTPMPFAPPGTAIPRPNPAGPPKQP